MKEVLFLRSNINRAQLLDVSIPQANTETFCLSTDKFVNVNISERIEKQEKTNTVKTKRIYWNLFVEFLNENGFTENDIASLSNTRLPFCPIFRKKELRARWINLRHFLLSVDNSFNQQNTI